MNKATLHKSILKNYEKPSSLSGVHVLEEAGKHKYQYIEDGKKALMKDSNECALKTDIFALGIVFYQMSLEQTNEKGKELALELARSFANPNAMT